MGVEEILKLIESVQQTDIQELEVSNGEWKVKIMRLMPSAGTAHTNGAPAVTEMPAGSVPSVIPAASSEPPEDPLSARSYIEITSPMVGTFYRSPEPDADSFVNDNDIVTPGQTMCIIEAMKLMNPIQSEIKGRVVEIMVDNAQPVEYGQKLILIKKD